MGQRHIERAREPDGDEALAIRLGREELVICRRYQTPSILNDFLIGIQCPVSRVVRSFLGEELRCLARRGEESWRIPWRRGATPPGGARPAEKPNVV